MDGALYFSETQRRKDKRKVSADNGGSLRWSTSEATWGGTSNQPVVVDCGGNITYDASMGVIAV